MFTPRRAPSTGAISKHEFRGLIPRALLLSLVVVSLFAFQVQGIAQIALPPPQVLENPDPKTDDAFGTSVSLSGGVMAIGSPGPLWPFGGTWQETVHLYELDPSTGNWIDATIDSTITGSVPGEIPNPNNNLSVNDDFGYSVSVSEDVLAVGARTYLNNAGCVYLYERLDTGEWKPADIFFANAGLLPGQILNPHGNYDDKFGWSVSVSGDLLVVGAPATSTYNNGQTPTGGVAWLFERNLATGEWQEVGPILNPAGLIIEAFGTSVSVNDADPGFIGDMIAIGQPVGVGAVSLYERNLGGAWMGVQTLINPNWSISGGYVLEDHFGESLSLFDGVLAVGAFLEDPNNTPNAGSVYLYERAQGPVGGALWVPAEIDLTISSAVAGEIPNPDPKPSELFGRSVSVWGDLLAVGEPGAPGSNPADTGLVHLFKRNQAGQWQPHVEVQHPNPWLTSDFGRSVAISSGTLAVGDPYASVVNNGIFYEEAGKAYLYQLEATFRRGDCNGDGNVDITDAIGALGILFGGAGSPDCWDSCDANDDGTMNISDVVFTLGYLFGGGPPPPDPGPVNCGPDPTVDNLDCVSGCL